MPTLPCERRETRRIILLRLQEGTAEVFLGREATGSTLPQVQVARGERIAPQLAVQVQQTCGLQAVAVSSVEADYELMEAHRSLEPKLRNQRWVAADSLVESEFGDRQDFLAVRLAVAQSIPSTENACRGPFACLGWFGALQRWVEKEIQTHGLQQTGGFRQLNACPTFSLIRFETDGPAVWFKAVGAPNQREYALTLALTHSCSQFLPAILATRAEWNGWLAREEKGPLLSELSTLQAWEEAAQDFAALQIHWLDKTAPLLDRGARDLRTRALADRVEPFFETMGEIIEQQTKIPPPRLSGAQLRILSARVEDALGVLNGQNTPDTIGHLDLNPGNIVCSPAGSKFLDWSEGFVGHPFLTFEYLREHFRRTFGQNHAQQAELLARYVSPWRAFISERDIHRALNVTSLIAVFACAIANDLWTDQRKLEEPRTAGYLRSLTRRMELEASALAERSLTCLS